MSAKSWQNHLTRWAKVNSPTGEWLSNPLWRPLESNGLPCAACGSEKPEKLVWITPMVKRGELWGPQSGKPIAFYVKDTGFWIGRRCYQKLQELSLLHESGHHPLSLLIAPLGILQCPDCGWPNNYGDEIRPGSGLCSQCQWERGRRLRRKYEALLPDASVTEIISLVRQAEIELGWS